MERVFLQNNKGFKWYDTGDCFVKGYILNTKGELYLGERLLEYFKEIDSFVDFEERVKYASGAFSVVIKKDEELFNFAFSFALEILSPWVRLLTLSPRLHCPHQMTHPHRWKGS